MAHPSKRHVALVCGSRDYDDYNRMRGVLDLPQYVWQLATNQWRKVA